MSADGAAPARQAPSTPGVDASRSAGFSSRLPAALWVALVFSPLLGWLSAVTVLIMAGRDLVQHGREALVLPLTSGAQRWFAAVAVGWWLTLLVADLRADATTAWWQDLRFLLAIAPAIVLMPRLRRAAITHEQLGRWAGWSVWVCAAVIAAEYLMVVQWAGITHHRPRALSGNALFVSTMLVPMMLLCWLAADAGTGRRRWLRPLCTHAVGLACLAGLLGARASTLIALALLPLPLLWLRRDASTVRRWAEASLVLAGSVAVLLVIGSVLSAWYGERWAALLVAMKQQDLTLLADYGISSRAQHWPAAWQAFMDKPWLGHGLRNETAALAPYLPAGVVPLTTAHQQFLSFLVWAGVPGLVSGCLLITLPLSMALCRQRQSLGRYAAMAVALPMLLNGLSDTVLDDVRIVSHYLMLAALVDALVEAAPTASAPAQAA